MGHCDLADIMLESGGYLAEFSSVRGGVCYRLFHKTSGREILRTPESEDALRENAFLYGNPVLPPPSPPPPPPQSHPRRRISFS